MSQNQLVQARVDGKIKSQAMIALADIGLTVSDAVRILLAKIARDKTMPLELFTPNAETMAALDDARNAKVKQVTVDEIRAVIRANN